MAKPQIATRVDTGVKKRIEQYADEQDVTESEAMRHLLTRGLDYEAGRLADEPDTADAVRQITMPATIIAGVAAVVAPELAFLLVALVVATVHVVATAWPLLSSAENSSSEVSADV